MDLRLRVPPRVIEPLSVEQVRRFWDSFATARDIAVVGLMLLNGLRSCEVLSLELEDLRLSEGQLRAHGKGGKVRMLPLPPETIRLLDCYLRTERPLTNAPMTKSPLTLIAVRHMSSSRSTPRMMAISAGLIPTVASTATTNGMDPAGTPAVPMLPSTAR